MKPTAESGSDMFTIRNGVQQGDDLSPMPFNFPLEYAIKRVQVNQNGFKLKDTHQLFDYADDVNILEEKYGSVGSRY